MAELVTSTRTFTQVPDFVSYAINKAADGTYNVSCTHSVALKDGEQNVADLGSVTFGLSYQQMIADPNFPAVYTAIKASARAGLASVRPDLVSA